MNYDRRVAKLRWKSWPSLGAKSVLYHSEAGVGQDRYRVTGTTDPSTGEVQGWVVDFFSNGRRLGYIDRNSHVTSQPTNFSTQAMAQQAAEKHLRQMIVTVPAE